MQKVLLIILAIGIVITSVLGFLLWKVSTNKSKNTAIIPLPSIPAVAPNFDLITQSNPNTPHLVYLPNSVDESWIGKKYTSDNVQILTDFYQNNPQNYPLTLTNNQGYMGINFTGSRDKVNIAISASQQAFSDSSFETIVSHIVASILKTVTEAKNNTATAVLNQNEFNSNIQLMDKDSILLNAICVRKL